MEAAIVIFDSFVLALCFALVIKVCLDTRSIRKGKERTQGKLCDIPKYASPLAFDDRVVLCGTVDEEESIRSKIEYSLKDINHVWNPQEVLQLLLLVKSYVKYDSHPDNVHQYYLLRFLESLVMHLNCMNGFCMDKGRGLSETNVKYRQFVFDEMNNLYYLAKDMGNTNISQLSTSIDNDTSKLPGQDMDLLNGSNGGRRSDETSTIKVDTPPKAKRVSVDADQRLLHDLQNNKDGLIPKNDQQGKQKSKSS